MGKSRGLGCKDQHVHSINIFNKIKLLSYLIVILIPLNFVSLSTVRVSVQLHKFPPSITSFREGEEGVGCNFGEPSTADKLSRFLGGVVVLWVSKNKSKLARRRSVHNRTKPFSWGSSLKLINLFSKAERYQKHQMNCWTWLRWKPHGTISSCRLQSLKYCSLLLMDSLH